MRTATAPTVPDVLDALDPGRRVRVAQEMRTAPALRSALVRVLDLARQAGCTPAEIVQAVDAATTWGASLGVRALWAIDALARARRA